MSTANITYVGLLTLVVIIAVAGFTHVLENHLIEIKGKLDKLTKDKE